MPDINGIQQQMAEAIGLDLRTGRAIRSEPITLARDIKKTLRILDEQNAINRYEWFNLPSGLDGQLLERMLYYRGQLAFFYMPETEQFFCLPYALCGTIDVYGRYQKITPLPFTGSASASATDNNKPWITGLERAPVYDVMSENVNPLESCVLLGDYSKQMSEIIIPRQSLQDPILDAMSEAFPMARTSLIANCGVKGIRVQTEDDAQNVYDTSRQIQAASVAGKPFIPTIGSTEFQNFTDGTALKSEEYLLYMQALDNFRLSLYGLDSGGLFQKKSHMLEAEQEMNAGHAKLSYHDGLHIRQRFCDMVNAIWGLGIWCEPSESVLAVDTNGDGIASDENDQSGAPGDQPQLYEEGSDDYE